MSVCKPGLAITASHALVLDFWLPELKNKCLATSPRCPAVAAQMTKRVMVSPVLTLEGKVPAIRYLLQEWTGRFPRTLSDVS